MGATKKAILYIALAWALIVCYSILLFNAAESILELANIQDESIKHIAIFIYGLAIVSFLGGSQVPAVFLKKKSFIIYFLFNSVFGFILLLITMNNQIILEFLNIPAIGESSMNPILALEYLSIPYFCMLFLDFYLSGRLSAFTWSDCGKFIKGIIFHPMRVFDDVRFQSTLFSLVSIVTVSIAWIFRNVAFSTVNFNPARWSIFSTRPVIQLNLVFKTTLMLPVMLLFWIFSSSISHFLAQKIGGAGNNKEMISLLGFSFLPSLAILPVDIIEYMLNFETSIASQIIFFTLGFIIPLVLWPILLASIAIRVSEDISWKKSCSVATISFLPFLILFSVIFM